MLPDVCIMLCFGYHRQFRQFIKYLPYLISQFLRYCYLHNVRQSKESIISSNLPELYNKPYHRSILIYLKMCVLVCLTTYSDY